MAPSFARRRVFALLALLIPVLVLGTLEGALRTLHYQGDLSLFVRVPFLEGRYSVANDRFPRRYFANVQGVPVPPADLFLTAKPTHAFRVFVLGESSAAGFPYGYNGTFSRIVRDALQDVLPGDTVEVVNLGVAAITSYAVYDEVDEILAQQPDAVLIYTGHNEFYGALGAGSTQTMGSFPAFVRTYLGLQRRFKTVLLARELAMDLAGRFAVVTSSSPDSSRSLMRRLVREELIPPESDIYRRGVRQFQDNLRAILQRFGKARVPVFVASLTSNLRDQHPFRSVATPTLPSAERVFADAQQALARGERARARTLFERARDLDALRFRAPSEFNAIIRRLASETGAHYVPVDEAFAAAAPDGIPGAELFWEHLHPNQAGYHLIGKTFFEALAQANFLGHTADRARLRSWPAYLAGMELTEFDRRYAWHQIRSLTASWPFVERHDPAGYPGNYRPVDVADSLAFEAVNRQDPIWPRAKFRLAEYYQSRGELQLAFAEYRGLMRDQPENATMRLYAADVLVQLNDLRHARELLERAYVLEPSAMTCYALGRFELRAARYDRAVSLLEQSLGFRADNPPVLFGLSRGYALKGDVRRARAYADRLALVSPGFSGLQEWQAELAALPD
jgi:lysophospholipase L1-like esterase